MDGTPPFTLLSEGQEYRSNPKPTVPTPHFPSSADLSSSSRAGSQTNLKSNPKSIDPSREDLSYLSSPSPPSSTLIPSSPTIADPQLDALIDSALASKRIGHLGHRHGAASGGGRSLPFGRSNCKNARERDKVCRGIMRGEGEESDEDEEGSEGRSADGKTSRRRWSMFKRDRRRLSGQSVGKSPGMPGKTTQDGVSEHALSSDEESSGSRSAGTSRKKGKSRKKSRSRDSTTPRSPPVHLTFLLESEREREREHERAHRKLHGCSSSSTSVDPSTALFPHLHVGHEHEDPRTIRLVVRRRSDLRDMEGNAGGGVEVEAGASGEREARVGEEGKKNRLPSDARRESSPTGVGLTSAKEAEASAQEEIKAQSHAISSNQEEQSQGISYDVSPHGDGMDRATPTSPTGIHDGNEDHDAGAHLDDKIGEGEFINLYGDSLSERREAIAEVRKLRKEVGQKFIWEVLFENQRGIMWRGTPHFSGRLLMPQIDPPAWTIPTHQPHEISAHPTTSQSAKSDPATHMALTERGHSRKNIWLSDRAPKPEAEEEGEIEGTDVQGQSLSTRWNQRRAARLRRGKQSMVTPYDVHTYQLPSSAWKWITPWMVNMRQDGYTDERGWEYNYVFRKTGWGCQVGKIGWGAWVRRRMWIRLRMLDLESALGKTLKLKPGNVAAVIPEDDEKDLERDILRAGREGDADDDQGECGRETVKIDEK